jgi:hypothetical protein
MSPNSRYPAPHKELLKAHFETALSVSLTAAAAAEPLDNYDDEYDEDEVSDIAHIPNDAVKIWAGHSHEWP